MTTVRNLAAPLATALLFLLTMPTTVAQPAIAEQLSAGKLAEAEQVLAEHLADSADDQLARFQLGTVQLLRAVEQLAQDGSRYGVLRNGMALPFIRLGGFGPRDSEPEQVEYEDVRAMIARFQKSVAAAEATLAPIDATDLYWRLDFGQVALDLNGNRQIEAGEQLDTLFRFAMTRRRANGEAASVVVGLDSADVYWMRGYCHVLMSLADMALAYDHQRMFDLTAHAFFANPDTKFAREHDRNLRRDADRTRPFWGSMESIADLIAAIHLMNFKLREPERMADARDHLLEMVKLSRANWKLVLQETDNRHELIPNPDQQSVIPGMAVDAARLDAWQRFLDEAEAILNGEKLLPFWRSGFDEGVNLGRVFTDPRDADVILWVQGTAALPYLERSEQTDPELWREFQRIFRGNFLGFALWTN